MKVTIITMVDEKLESPSYGTTEPFYTAAWWYIEFITWRNRPHWNKYGVFVVKSRSSSIFLLEQKHKIKNSCERGTLEKDAKARTRWNKTSHLKVKTSMFLFNDLKTPSKIVTFIKFLTPNLLVNLNQWPIRTHKSNRGLENLCYFCCVVWFTWSWIL